MRHEISMRIVPGQRFFLVHLIMPIAGRLGLWIGPIVRASLS